MIKHLLSTLLLTVFTVGVSQAQSQSPVEQAMRHLEQKATQWQLQSDDYKDALISDMYTDKKTGNTYIYFQQAIDGIPVDKAITPVVIAKNGKAYNIASRFIPQAKSKVVKAGEKVDSRKAVELAALQLGVQSPKVPATKRSVKDGAEVYSNLDFAHNDVKVTKQYTYVNDQLIPVWSLSLDLKGTADYWNAKISIADGTLVAKDNYTVYCNHDHGKYSKHTSCAATKKVEAPKAKTQTEVNSALMMGATYNVFAFPTESPIHGERTVITDGMYPDASPHGWHDVNNMEGAEFTITRGNNVHAYLDLEDSGFSSGDEVDGGDELMFDMPFDLNEEHRDNIEFSQVNLFTTVNQVHDITHRLGFNEAAGNFQQNNYGNGGNSGDAINAEALDGFTLHEQMLDLDANGNPQKIDNANFRTPSDGQSGVMQMFLWENNGGALSIDEPANISGFIAQIGTADFGTPVPFGSNDAITGQVALARDDDPASPTQTCGDVANPDEINGKIALIDRGSCAFSQKVFNAQQAGATACIICNVPGADSPGSSGEAVNGMTGELFIDEITITSIFVAKSTCDRMRGELNQGNEVSITLKERDAVGPAYRDGSLDLGVIAHEFGHGISNRIIGGPGNAGCLTSREQMGEGISDLFALYLTVEEGDTRTDARGIGNFVEFLSPEAGGIRTFPYTTDLVINPRNYSEIPSFTALDENMEIVSQIYPLGEVWAIAMWEMYWNIVDQKGLDITWNDETAGNFIAGRLAIEGMKIAPCNPTLLDMRDGVLAADEMLYGGENALAIWTAFAKRGMGYKATAGSTNDLSDNEADYEIFPLLIQTLKIDKTANTLVQAGDEVEITINAANHIPETKTGVVITDQIPAGATYVDGSASQAATVNGGEISFDIGTMEYEATAVITYKVTVDAGVNSNTIYYDNIDDGAASSYDIQFLEGFSLWGRTSLDANSGERSLFVRNSDTEENDQILNIHDIKVSGNRPVLRFYHKYDTELPNDGGFVRISTDGGSQWQFVSDDFIRNGYTADIDYSTFAIPNLRGFSGSSNGEWVDSYIDLSAYKGKTISLQLRFGSDDNTAGEATNPGWFVDDLEIFDLKAFSSVACIVSDAGDDEECSGQLDFIVESNGVVSTEDDLKFEHLSIGIAPNPASDFVTININSEKGETLNLELTTLEGKTISSQTVINATKAARSFDVSQLQAGVYFLTVRSENEVVTTQRIVVQ